jgi:uncharacterized OB-fold protein
MTMQRDIYAYQCKKCGHLHYPYRMVCPGCKENKPGEFEARPLPHNGKILTFTRVHNLPAEFDVAVLQLGIVELENGLRILGQLAMEHPEIGMAVEGKVEIVRSAEYEKNYGMVFYEA